MIIGTARIVLSLPGNDSLKGKRKVLRRVVDRVRHRHNAAIAEVADQDEHRRAVLGLAVVSNDGRHAQSMLDTVLDFVEQSSEVPITERRTELLHLGDGEHYGMELDWDVEAEERLLAGDDDGRG
ncbi:MAG TPA: DUF503 domain-containing protein [Sandaracinaceae bacterium LLY-WYZ-13_1]|nr:DUF503 domain-containing protein [Sandaracinaceae bacterium LLY-WYZ-13_1]